MARIRTIKPELWSDPEFVECSTNARLLLIASLNFASDYGVLHDKPTQLKMQCFPGDSIDVEPLIDELVEAGFYVRRTAPDGAKVFVIRTFTMHQRVDKPQLGRWGNPAKWGGFDDHSPNVLGTVSERSEGEGNGMEGKGKLLTPPTPPPGGDPLDAHPNPCPRCNAPAGKPCTKTDGTISPTHRGRSRATPEPDTSPIRPWVPEYGATDPKHPPDCRCQGTAWIYPDPDQPGVIPCPGPADAVITELRKAAP